MGLFVKISQVRMTKEDRGERFEMVSYFIFTETTA